MVGSRSDFESVEGGGPTDDPADLDDPATLREMLLASERRRAEAERSRQQAEMVLEGLQLLSTAVDVDDVLAQILGIIGGAVPYDVAAVLVEDEDGFDVLTTTASADSFHLVEIGPFTERILNGRPTVVVDLESVPGLEVLARPPLRYRSGLFTALVGARRRALLVCLASEVGCYSRQDLDLLGYLTPLASQALRRFDEDRRIEELLGQLHHMAHSDPLTGLANRARFDEELRRRIGEQQREGVELALLQIDVDGLKIVNDTFGHQCGDGLLLAVTEGIRRATRSEDLCVRLGGDEFAVLLGPDQPLDAAWTVAERIIERTSEPYRFDDQVLTPRVSVGIGVCRMPDGQPERIVEFADRALYRAKYAGGSQVVVFDRKMQAAWLEERRLELELAAALEQHQLDLHYQPIVAAETGRIAGYEALLRWRHPVHGLMSADEFLDAVVESEMVVEIGRWVFGRAMADLADWLSAEAGRRLTVNVAVREVLTPGFVADMLRRLDRFGLSPHHLELELGTATVSDRRRSGFDATLRQLHDAGIGTALCPLGKGASTLDRFRAAAGQRVKIDRRLSARLPETGSDRAVVEAMVTLAHRLGMSVVLEGVENSRQLEIARSLGIDEVQGFHIARPEPLHRLSLSPDGDPVDASG